MPIFRRGKQEAAAPAAAPSQLWAQAAAAHRAAVANADQRPPAPATPQSAATPATPVAPPAPPQPTPAERLGLPAARIPADYGDPVFGELLAVAGRRDWSAIRGFLAPFDVRGVDVTSLVGNLPGRDPAVLEWLPQVLAQHDDDPLAVVVRAVLKQQEGFNARGAARAKYVSRDQFATLHGCLAEAEEMLFHAIDLDRDSVLPWYFLLHNGIGLNPGVDVSRRRFEAVVTRCPGHPAAHRQLLNILCRKWYGSHEEMHAFATESMRGPHGDRLGDLVPAAYIERWLDVSDAQERKTCLHKPEIRAELQEAADRTIFRPGFTAEPRNPYRAANVFAQAFSFAGMWPQAVEAFKATDGAVVGRWEYWSNKGAAYSYTTWRDFALGKV